MFPKETIVKREPSMGRKKRYDRGVLIGKAVEIFRDRSSSKRPMGFGRFV